MVYSFTLINRFELNHRTESKNKCNTLFNEYTHAYKSQCNYCDTTVKHAENNDLGIHNFESK